MFTGIVQDLGTLRRIGAGEVEIATSGSIVERLEIPGDRVTHKGYLLPVFAQPDKCNACGICAWMCPRFAIEVYRYVETAA